MANDKIAKKILRSQTLITQMSIESDQITKRDIGAWRAAHQRAVDIQNPKRNDLYNIYDYTVDLDNVVTGVVLRTKYGVMKRCFQLVDNSGKENPDTTKIFQAEWFKEYMSFALDAHYQGHSLIELGDIVVSDNLMSFSGVRLLPRRHVCPEYGVILKEYGDEPKQGLPYRQGSLAKYVVEAGSPYALGAYLKICPNTISKKNAQIFWDNFAEKFGIPIVYASIDSRDTSERLKASSMLKSLGSNAWALFGTDVKLNIVETKTGDAFEVFDRRITRADAQISVALAGQTMSFSDGSSLSQAEVHERGFMEIKDNMADDLANNINNRLIPKMADLGFPVRGFTFRWNNTRQYTAEELMNVEAMLLQHYKIKKEYFENKYGVQIEGNKESSLRDSTLAHKPELDFFV